MRPGLSSGSQLLPHDSWGTFREWTSGWQFSLCLCHPLWLGRSRGNTSTCETGTQLLEPSLFLPWSALMGSWSKELEPEIEPRCPCVGHSHLDHYIKFPLTELLILKKIFSIFAQFLKVFEKKHFLKIIWELEKERSAVFWMPSTAGAGTWELNLGLPCGRQLHQSSPLPPRFWTSGKLELRARAVSEAQAFWCGMWASWPVLWLLGRTPTPNKVYF